MDALRQILDDYCPARGAALTCPAWVNCSHFSTSVRRFVGRVLNQLIPSRVLNALTQTMIPDHASNVQIFKGDDSELRYERVTKLMREVAATVSNAFVDTPCRFSMLFSLCLRKCLLIRPKESRISNPFACRKSSEARQANVNSYRSIIRGHGSRFDFHREARIPLARCGACDSQSLNLAFNQSVQLNSHVSDFRQAQLVTVDGEAGLSVGERVVSFVRAKARKACSLFSLHPTKETIKCFFYSLQNILQDLAVDARHIFTNLFDVRQLVRLFNVPHGLSFEPVCVAPFLQTRVVEFAAKRKGAIQASSLCLAWTDAVAKCFEYYLFNHARHAKSVSCLGESRKAVSRNVSARWH